MSLKPTRRSLETAASLALGTLMAACSMAPKAPAPATPATLAAVHSLAPHTCNAQTAAVLDELGVPPDQIRSITYDQRTVGKKSSYLQGYDVWVQTSDGSGDVLIRQDRWCRFFTKL
jgi:hypothetical protein